MFRKWSQAQILHQRCGAVAGMGILPPVTTCIFLESNWLYARNSSSCVLSYVF